jgi:hypothetical protein
MSKAVNPLTWFNDKIRTKDDLQFVSIGIFIVFIVFVKCYTVFSPTVQAKAINYQAPQKFAAPVVNVCCKNKENPYIIQTCCNEKSPLKCCNNKPI